MDIKDQLITIDEALSLVRDDMRIVTSMAAAEPHLFLRNIHRRAKELKQLRVFCANPSEQYPCFDDPDLVGRMELATMFLTSGMRKKQERGIIRYIPQHLSQWVRNLQREGSIDIFWGSCTIPDERGFVNLGPNACYETEALRMADVIILEVNPNLPTTMGATTVPISWVDHFIESEAPLATISRPSMHDVDRKIAEHVAEMVPDRATIQLGIGSIPNAIGEALRTKKDLGVHTEMINDTIMDLYVSGAITGRYKSIWPGKIVGSFALGSEELYDFVDKNPVVVFEPSSVVNDPYRIGRNSKMVSINSAIEIDITGQVCSESVGHRELSGVGGATDTHTGAQRSEGGRGIIAMHSTTADEATSKIVFELKPGAKVSISRNDIDTIVTEYGVAELKGATVWDRVTRMISVSHPKFRDELLSQAREAGYINGSVSV